MGCVLRANENDEDAQDHAVRGYFGSRTVGMPGLPVDPCFEPLGVLSLSVEGLFVTLAPHHASHSYQENEGGILSFPF